MTLSGVSNPDSVQTVRRRPNPSGRRRITKADVDNAGGLQDLPTFAEFDRELDRSTGDRKALLRRVLLVRFERRLREYR